MVSTFLEVGAVNLGVRARARPAPGRQLVVSFATFADARALRGLEDDPVERLVGDHLVLGLAQGGEPLDVGGVLSPRIYEPLTGAALLDERKNTQRRQADISRAGRGQQQED